MFDYETLRVIWWLLLGVLLTGFAIMDGFDLGIATLLRVLTHDDDERRALLETIEPTWEGNQTWLVLGAGAIFAAWPLLYAAAFSGFYFAMLLLLLALIVRPVGFNFRNKLADPRWRDGWDWAVVFAGFIPLLVFGVAFGDLFLGLPFSYDETLRITWTGGLFDLFHPFAVLSGLISIALLTMHGAAWAAVKADELIARRAERMLRLLSPVFVVLYAAAGAWLWFGIAGYRILGAPGVGAPSNPLTKQVALTGSWLGDGPLAPYALIAAAAAIVMALAVPLLATRRRHAYAFVASAVAVAGTIFSAGFALFPFLMPSSLQPQSSLTVWDASSSKTTLGLMLVATAIFMPLILAYTTWVYRVLRGRVTLEHIRQTHGMY